MIRKTDVMPMFLEACPSFGPRWREHLEYWNGEPAGHFNDVAEFVYFIVEEYAQGNRGCVELAFETLERIIIEGDEDARGLGVVGFIESLQNVASWRDFGADAFLPFLKPRSKQAWAEVNSMWKGKHSLTDVIRGQRGGAG